MTHSFVLWRYCAVIVRGKRYWEDFLAEDGNGNLSILYAKVYKDIVKAGDEVRRRHMCSGERWYVRLLGDREWLRIRKHKLKVRGKGLFSLPINTPAGIFADAYEDAGMPEEAGVLRS